MIVTLDTCIIGQDFNLDGLFFQLLFDNRHLTHHQVVVPEVVVQETINHFREKLAADVAKLTTAARDINKLTLEKVKVPVIDQAKALDYLQRSLRHKLGVGGTSILPLPKIRQQQLIDRALKRRKPFNPSGNGYRDTLIWETLLAYGRKHRKDRVAFLTNNTKDFCDSGQLHPDLVEDLVAAKLPKDYVVMYTSLQEFVEREVIPALPKPHKAFVDYTIAHWPKFRLADAVGHLLLDHLAHREIDPGTLGKPWYFEDPTITGVGDADDVEILDEHKVGQKQRVLELRMKSECLFDCYIEKHEYWCLDPEYQPSATDWNETYMAAQFDETIEIHAYSTFDEKRGDLVDLEITDISGPDEA